MARGVRILVELRAWVAALRRRQTKVSKSREASLPLLPLRARNREEPPDILSRSL